jgi:hypothetical protein
MTDKRMQTELDHIIKHLETVCAQLHELSSNLRRIRDQPWPDIPDGESVAPLDVAGAVAGAAAVRKIIAIVGEPPVLPGYLGSICVCGHTEEDHHEWGACWHTGKDHKLSCACNRYTPTLTDPRD